MNQVIDTSKLSVREKRKLVKLLEQKEHLKRYGGHLYKIFPEEGPLAYSNYPRHMAFFKAGKEHKERLFMAANRVGKTLAGAYEVACHLTGIYPPWWLGYRFMGPNDWWVAGNSGSSTRDGSQNALLGNEIGTGMIPQKCVLKFTSKPGVPGAIDKILVKHEPTGGTSTCGFKSYEQRRKAFEAVARHGIWFDEEPFNDVYNEGLMRTLTTRGMMITTLTPMEGLTEFITEFLDSAVSHTEEEECLDL